MSKINNINKKNVEKLLKYFKENGKIRYAIDNEIILFKINDFKELHNRWFNEKEKKKKTKCVIEVEKEVEKEVEEENLKAQTVHAENLSFGLRKFFMRDLRESPLTRIIHKHIWLPLLDSIPPRLRRIPPC